MTRRLPLVALALAGALAAGCNRPAPEHLEEAPPVAVTVAAATVVDLAEHFDAGGVTASSESAVVAARILAPVRTVQVRAGDRVRAGDVLVTLDARDVAANARQATATIEAAEHGLVQARNEQTVAAAEHTLAVAWQGRIATLRERNSATAQELDEATARLAGATARAAAAAAAVQQAEAHLAGTRAASDAASVAESFTVIRAPFAGEITERFVDPGALATPGMPLLHLDAAGGRRVDVRVDESRVRYVRPGDRAAVMLDGGEDDQPIDGTVTEIARAIAIDQHAFTVKIALPAGVTPRTGTFARIRFAGAPRRALVVPTAAIRHQGQVTSVFVARNGVARLRLVQLGETDGTTVEIVSGLDPGEEVITPPPPQLTDGRRVSSAAAGGRR